jgi:hypothetical protein
MDYGSCLFFTAAAGLLFVLAFTPKFSAVTLANALLLATAFVPLATDRLDVGTGAGWLLWQGNAALCVALLVPWAVPGYPGGGGRRVLVSLLGLTAFGVHDFLFMATP